MGAQGRFSEADFIPPGHTSRGLRPSAGRLCLCVGVDLSLQQQTHVSTAHVPPLCMWLPSVSVCELSFCLSSLLLFLLMLGAGLLRASAVPLSPMLEQVTEEKEGLWRLREAQIPHSSLAAAHVLREAWGVAACLPRSSRSPALCQPHATSP